MGMVEREGTEGSEGQNRKEEEREGGSGTQDEVQGPLARARGRDLDICAGGHRIPSYATADGAGLE